MKLPLRQDIPPLLRQRALLLNYPPSVALPQVPTGILLELASFRCDPDEAEALRQKVARGLKGVQPMDCWELLQAQACVSDFLAALEPEEGLGVLARVALRWASDLDEETSGRLLAGLALEPAENSLPTLALLGLEMRPDRTMDARALEAFLQDPRSVDLPLEFAQTRRHKHPAAARRLLEATARESAGLFDVHMALAELARDQGQVEEARMQARQVLLALGWQPREHLEWEVRQEVEQSARKILASLAEPAPARPEATPGHIDWTRACAEAPCQEILQEGDLEPGRIDDTLDDFINDLEEGRFHTWEAALRAEQGLPLTASQSKGLSEILNLSDDPEGPVLHIDDQPRPTEPWYATLRRLTARLPLVPIHTSATCFEAYVGGWGRLAKAVEEHGEGLERPEDAPSPLEVIPEALRHRLDLQSCHEILVGLGQSRELNLRDQASRAGDFLDALRECPDSVAWHRLTLRRLFQEVVLPVKDREILKQHLRDTLGLGSEDEEIAPRL